MTLEEALRRLGLHERVSPRKVNRVYGRLSALVDPAVGAAPNRAVAVELRAARDVVLDHCARSRNRHRTRGVGWALLCSALVAAVALLYVRPASREIPGGAFDQQQSIGIAVEGAESASIPWSYGVDVHEVVHSGLFGCGDADVSVFFSPNSGFWNNYHRSIPPRVHFAIGFHGADVHDVAVLTVPARLAVSGAELGDIAFFSDDRSADLQRGRMAVHSDPPRRVPSGTVVTGWIDGWRRNWYPIAVHFKAAWTRMRSVGTCFVSLPQLTGGLGGFLAGEALHRQTGSKTTSTTTATEANTGLDLVGGRLLMSDTDPPPQKRTEIAYLWSCSAVRGNYVPIARTLPLSITSPDRSTTSTRPRPAGERLDDCGGMAVISTPNSEAIRAAALFLLGALASLGCQMIYDAHRTGRRFQPEA